MPMRPPTHRPQGMADPKKSKQYRSKEQRQRDRWYNNPRWKRLAKMIRARDQYICQECGRPGNQVDHIEEREQRPDLEYSMENLQVLCVRCHNRKRAKGVA